MVTVGIINVLNAIWHSRNQERFQNKHFSWQMAINMVVSNVSLIGNKTKKVAAINMAGFELLKAFKIQIHPTKPPLIKEIIWQPPCLNWIKANTNGAMIKNPTKASCGGIFRDSNGSYLGSFAQNLNTTSSFNAELILLLPLKLLTQKVGSTYGWKLTPNWSNLLLGTKL